MTTTTKKTTEQLVNGDLVLSTLHGRYVRFVRWEGLYAVVMDRNTLAELPDLVHPALLKVA